MLVRISIALYTATLFLASCVTYPTLRNGGISEADVREVTPVIRKETSEPILVVTRRPDGIVEVSTGSHGYQGTGELFVLRKKRGVWRIIKTGMWMA